MSRSKTLVAEVSYLDTDGSIPPLSTDGPRKVARFPSAGASTMLQARRTDASKAPPSTPSHSHSQANNKPTYTSPLLDGALYYQKQFSVQPVGVVLCCLHMM